MSNRTNTTAAAAPASTRRASAVIETLEQRQHLSVSPSGGSATFLFGAVVVTGTNGPDAIRVSMSDPALATPRSPQQIEVRVNERLVGTFAARKVALGIHILAGAGDDMVMVDDSMGTVPSGISAFGGDGNDMLFGGSLNDALFGGAGDDLVSGNDGNDVLSGDDGNDVVTGGFGNDLLGGGDGDDVLLGDFGNDALFGEGGNDILDGGEDNDYLDGGTGDDLLIGGAGHDRFARGSTASEVLDLSADDVVLG